MKKLFALIMAGAMALSLAACTVPAAPAPAPEVAAPEAAAPEAAAPEAAAPAAGIESAAGVAANASKKVAGVVFQEDQFMKLLQMGYADIAKERGYEFVPANTNNDQGKESELINTYVDQKIGGIAISPISEAASLAALQNAYNNGIVIGLSNTLYDGDPNIVCSYSSDNYELGKATGMKAAEFIKEKLGGKAKVAIVQFKSQLPEQSGARAGGFIDQVKGIEGVEIVTDQDAWLQDKAITLVTDILTANPDINVIFAANEGGTIGAAMAVQNIGKAGQTYVFGTDASEQIIDLLKDPADVLQAVTGQDPYFIGAKTMGTVIDAMEGKDVSDVKGKGTIIPGVTLSRTAPEEFDTFLKDLNEKVAKLG